MGAPPSREYSDAVDPMLCHPVEVTDPAPPIAPETTLANLVAVGPMRDLAMMKGARIPRTNYHLPITIHQIPTAAFAWPARDGLALLPVATAMSIMPLAMTLQNAIPSSEAHVATTPIKNLVAIDASGPMQRSPLNIGAATTSIISKAFWIPCTKYIRNKPMLILGVKSVYIPFLLLLYLADFSML